MVRYVGNPRGVLSIHISTRALSGASLEIESESAPLLFISRYTLARRSGVKMEDDSYIIRNWVEVKIDAAADFDRWVDRVFLSEEFKPSAMAGSFDFTVSVKDVTIGDKASVDNLKKLFGLEGAESLDTAAFSSEKVALDFKEPQDGKLKFTATPAVDNAKSFFMKVKVK